MKRKRRYRSDDEIREIVESFKESGLTQSAFARQIGVHVSVLGRWVRGRRRIPSPQAASAFVPVHVTAPPPEPTPERALEVVVGSGRVVRVHPGFNEEALGRLVGVLERC
jgi:transposase-like protein